MLSENKLVLSDRIIPVLFNCCSIGHIFTKLSALLHLSQDECFKFWGQKVYKVQGHGGVQHTGE